MISIEIHGEVWRGNGIDKVQHVNRVWKLLMVVINNVANVVVTVEAASVM